jgi:hypothetical protein
MSLVHPPRAPIHVRLIAWVGALIVAGGILYLVFNFGYYASGLAVLKEQEKLRRETPIQMEFADPNKPPPASPK